MFNAMKKMLRFALLAAVVIVAVGYIMPDEFTMPVDGARLRSYDQSSFWAYPWGKSITHKGVDIFARKGTLVKSSTSGVVLLVGKNALGGNVVYVLGPRWKIHYYAHLNETRTSTLSMLSSGDVIGTVGTTGNAKGKPPHLHYTMQTIFPFFWRADRSVQGWKKMFYLNPIPYLNKCIQRGH
jgi:murein DD-endopeptidase MepM/ murein hydrolase activator NlpD